MAAVSSNSYNPTSAADQSENEMDTAVSLGIEKSITMEELKPHLLPEENIIVDEPHPHPQESIIMD